MDKTRLVIQIRILTLNLLPMQPHLQEAIYSRPCKYVWPLLLHFAKPYQPKYKKRVHSIDYYSFYWSRKNLNPPTKYIITLLLPNKPNNMDKSKKNKNKILITILLHIVPLVDEFQSIPTVSPSESVSQPLLPPHSSNTIS